MKRLLTRSAISVLAIACTLSAQQPSRSKPSEHIWHMRKVDVTTQVMDLQTHGGRSILGMTMLVPSDWSFKGQAVLTPKFDCNYTIGRFNVETQSPDKSSGLSIRALGTTVWSTICRGFRCTIPMSRAS